MEQACSLFVGVIKVLAGMLVSTALLGTMGIIKGRGLLVMGAPACRRHALLRKPPPDSYSIRVSNADICLWACRAGFQIYRDDSGGSCSSFLLSRGLPEPCPGFGG